jgi:hypothetical protein
MWRRGDTVGMDQTDTPKRRNDYRIRSQRAWTLIRERYLAGQSAPRLAEVFDTTEAAIRARAGREGWTKRAMAEAMPVEPADAGLAEVIAGQLDGDLTPREAARLALGEAVKLIRGGKMGLAGEAARVADVMGRAAARLGDEAADPGEPSEAEFEAVRRKVMGWDDAGAPPPPFGWSPSPQSGEETGADPGAPPPPFGRSPSPRGGEETA